VTVIGDIDALEDGLLFFRVYSLAPVGDEESDGIDDFQLGGRTVSSQVGQLALKHLFRAGSF
jgi:hypothetical protein